MKNSMRFLRVVAVGLLIAAVLMLHSAQIFFEYWVQSVPFFGWALGVRTISPPLAATGGFDFVPAAVFLLLCLGVGLLISTTMYYWLETTFGSFIGASSNVGATGTGRALAE